MLTCLRVKNLAIVDALELELGPGLSVITGETGAGKSILVDALELVLGARGRPELVRSGAAEAEVEALFDLTDCPAVTVRLQEAGFDVAGELVVRRVLRAEGRSRAYIDGRLASQRQLAELSAGLATLSSQHEHHGLTEARQQLALLDAFAEGRVKVAAMAKAYETLTTAREAVEDFERRARESAEREELLRYQLREIDEVAPEEGEDRRLTEEHGRLAHAGHLTEVTEDAEESLLEAENAVSAGIARVAMRLAEAARHDECLGAWSKQLDEARVIVEDVARESGAYARRIDDDPERLDQVDERLSALHRLARRHGGDLDAVLSRRALAARELGDLDRRDELHGQLVAARDGAEKAARRAARALRALRKKAAGRLGKAVTGELSSLGMEGARLEIMLHDAPLGPSGSDRAEVLFAPNRGEATHALSRIASGGELSRILLAIKRVLADREGGGLHVFDEVDTGIGGSVAETVGRKLREVAQGRQVLCITHLPQVAVFADTHYHVAKGIVGGRTVSRVGRLAGGDRLDALARMLGGARLTKKTRAAAAELLEDARAA